MNKRYITFKSRFLLFPILGLEFRLQGGEPQTPSFCITELESGPEESMRQVHAHVVGSL